MTVTPFVVSPRVEKRGERAEATSRLAARALLWAKQVSELSGTTVRVGREILRHVELAQEGEDGADDARREDEDGQDGRDDDCAFGRRLSVRARTKLSS